MRLAWRVKIFVRVSVGQTLLIPIEVTLNYGNRYSIMYFFFFIKNGATGVESSCVSRHPAGRSLILAIGYEVSLNYGNRFFVRSVGFEPTTTALKVQYSAS